jgi:hypothetical protein
MLKESFSRKAVEQLIHQYGRVEAIEQFDGCKVYVLDNGATIRLKDGFDRIAENVVYMIAIEKLGIDDLEYDYWHGRN